MDKLDKFNVWFFISGLILSNPDWINGLIKKLYVFDVPLGFIYEKIVSCIYLKHLSSLQLLCAAVDSLYEMGLVDNNFSMRSRITRL